MVLVYKRDDSFPAGVCLFFNIKKERVEFFFEKEKRKRKKKKTEKKKKKTEKKQKKNRKKKRPVILITRFIKIWIRNHHQTLNRNKYLLFYYLLFIYNLLFILFFIFSFILLFIFYFLLKNFISFHFNSFSFSISLILLQTTSFSTNLQNGRMLWIPPRTSPGT